MTAAKRFTLGCAAAGFVMLCAFYYRQFHKVLRISTGTERLFRPHYQLSFGYYLAKNAADMQNQTTPGWNGELAPDASRGLLLSEDWTPHDWTHSWKILPSVPVYRFNCKTALTNLKSSSLVSMDGIDGGTKTVESSAPFEFLRDSGDPPEQRENPNLQTASTLLEFSVDLLKRVYAGGIPVDSFDVPSDVVSDVPYFSNWIYSPPLRFDLESNTMAPVKRVKQSAAFSVRSFRNYFLDGNYHAVYLQVEPIGGNTQLIESLDAELDRASFESVPAAARSRINCLDVSTQGEGGAARKFVRASRCRARVDIQLADGRIGRVGGEFTEEPLDALAWMCSGGKNALRCRSIESSTSIQALSMTSD